MKKKTVLKPGSVYLALSVLGLVLLYAGGLFGLFSGNIMRYLLQIYLYTVLGEAWNLLSGFAGMTSLGQQLYIGLAGYTVAVVSGRWNIPMIGCLLAGALVSVLSALVLSRVLFRMKGMYFAIGTWVAAEAVQMAFLGWKFVNQGGGMTVNLVPYPPIGKLYLTALTLCAVSILLIGQLLNTRLGLALKTMRDDPTAASSIGVNLPRTRLIIYLLAALLTSLSGGLFFINKGMIYPDSGFGVSWTVSAVFICIIGGTGTVSGPLAGSCVYVLLREFLAHYPGWSNIMLGIITIVVILFLPEGIIGTLKHSRLLRKTVSYRPVPAAEAPCDTPRKGEDHEHF